jgi:hypothetical protein
MQVLEAIERRRIARRTVFADGQQLSSWLEQQPLGIVKEKLQRLHLHPKSADERFTSLADWRQALQVPCRARQKDELETDCLEAIERLQTDKKEDFADEDALRAWLQKEPLHVLREKVLSIPWRRKDWRKREWRRREHRSVKQLKHKQCVTLLCLT